MLFWLEQKTQHNFRSMAKKKESFRFFLSRIRMTQEAVWKKESFLIWSGDKNVDDLL